jgi:hypothetical protein
MTSFEKNSHPLMAAAAPQAGGPPQGGGMPGGGPMMGGGPGGQRGQAAPDLGQTLSKYVLPSKPITDSDIAGVRTMMDAVCAEITTSIKSAKVSDETLKTGVLAFRDWLKKQGCVANVTSPYSIESADKYAAEIFAVYPGTLPFHFEFKMAGSANKPYRVLLFITKVDGFSVASLVGNKTTLTGVPFPKDWPENPWTYWNNPV